MRLHIMLCHLLYIFTLTCIFFTVIEHWHFAHRSWSNKSLGSEQFWFNNLIRFGRNIILYQWTLRTTLFPIIFILILISKSCSDLVPTLAWQVGGEQFWFNNLIRFGRNIILYQWTLRTTLFPIISILILISKYLFRLSNCFGLNTWELVSPTSTAGDFLAVSGLKSMSPNRSSWRYIK